MAVRPCLRVAPIRARRNLATLTRSSRVQPTPPAFRTALFRFALVLQALFLLPTALVGFALRLFAPVPLAQLLLPAAPFRVALLPIALRPPTLFLALRLPGLRPGVGDRTSADAEDGRCHDRTAGCRHRR